MSQSLSNPDLYINRELSWLDFNERVLEEAVDGHNPLLERVKFLAIVASNLDEFFEVRVAGLMQLRESGATPRGADRMPPQEQLERIAERAHRMVADQYCCWNDQLLPALAAEGIHLIEARQLEGEHLRFVRDYWAKELEPILTPIVVDPSHPLPRVLNKALCIGALLKTQGRTTLGVVTVPRALPRILKLPRTQDADYFVTLSGIMDLLIGELFSGYQVLGTGPFRITRNSELYVNDEEADNLMEEMAEQLKNRRKGDAVRLETATGTPDQLVERLRREFNLADDQVYRAEGPVNLHRVMNLYSIVPRPDLKFPDFTPVERKLPTEPESFFATLREDDVLLHMPYESFATVTDFISMAARDPAVLAIKQTIYRTGDDSQVAQALIDAAEQGKEVTALVELKARNDEATNIEWAKLLEDSGVQVIYGVMGLKTHCKLCMLVRRDADQLRRYVHLGTGNFNHITARFYTDLGLLTARPDITADVAAVFNLLTAGTRPDAFNKLLVAPSTMMKGFLERIEREIDHAEAGRPAAIIGKMNGLMDPRVIEELYRASQAGVQIDLIVRGICCLRAGVPGVSDNIRVYSIIGRYLEHSRIYYFANGDEMEIWAGSADWMNRNLRGRVEVVFPIEAPKLKKRVFSEILELCLQDRTKARQMQTDGTYIKRSPKEGESIVCMQEGLMQLALGQDLEFPVQPSSGNGRPGTVAAKS
ncbi:MAG: polyphosphate kinase 1 [Candidatus Latescibacteria bacterium]|nr:polyphosphate kinase 1 [Candidatus Latescibacterota bacterium]